MCVISFSVYISYVISLFVYIYVIIVIVMSALYFFVYSCMNRCTIKDHISQPLYRIVINIVGYYKLLHISFFELHPSTGVGQQLIELASWPL